MIGISLSPFTRATRNDVLHRLLEAEHLATALPRKTEAGKPYLELAGKQHGLAITHIRQEAEPFSVMAVSPIPELGIDAEIWPAKTDSNFLQTVAAPEDETVIRHINSKAKDAATFLWVLKEAALKASGDVMTDPRCISVEMSPNGHFWAATSRTSTKPVNEASLRVWLFSAPDQPRTGLMAMAISGPAAANAWRKTWVINAPGLNLLPF